MSKILNHFSRQHILAVHGLILLACLSFQAALSVASVKRPMVAISPIKSQDKNYSYVGPAVTQMLETRLSSEGIDTFIVEGSGKGLEAAKLADFLVAGQVVRNEKTFDAEILLKEPGNGEVLKTWHLRAATLEALARDTGLFSVKLAETIKHAEDILIESPVEADMAGQDQGNPVSDEFAMARMHPDRLVREQLVKDEEKEKALERQKTEEQKRIERQQAKARQKEPEEWFPVPDVYDEETDEPPRAEEQEQPSPEVSADEGAEAAQVLPPEGKGRKSWFSSLWPFGGAEEEKESWEKEREKLNAQQEESRHAARVVPPDDLPYPPPPEIQFNIPEPEPLDQALAKIDRMYVEKPSPRKEEGWLSRLWPWGKEEEAEPVIPEREAAKNKSVQARIEPGSEVHEGVSSMIEGIAGGAGSRETSENDHEKRPAAEGAEPGSEVNKGMNGMIEELPAERQYRPEEMQRQEHVYFGPRIRRDERQEEETGIRPTENPAPSGPEKDLRARVEEPSRDDVVSAAPVERLPENVSRAGTVEEELHGTVTASAPSDTAAAGQEPGAPAGGKENEKGETGTSRPADFDGPIWRWY